jgi:hypothetical protein
MHVFIEAAQLVIPSVDAMVVRLVDTSVVQSSMQVLQRGPYLVTAALNRIWAGTERQMLFHETLLVWVKTPKVKPAMSRPSREVRDGAEVYARCIRSVAPLDQAAPIGRHERRQNAVAQPLRRHRVNRIECIHDDLLRWGCHRRKRSVLCEVQNRVRSSYAATYVPAHDASLSRFALKRTSHYCGNV